jgi:hypothetical protein
MRTVNEVLRLPAIRERACNDLSFDVVVLLVVNSSTAMDAVQIIELILAGYVRADYGLPKFIFSIFVHYDLVAKRTFVI